MEIPRWEKPKWVGLKPSDLKNYSETEIREMLKDALRHTKNMPDSVVWKPQMIELGRCALRINKWIIQMENGVSDEEREQLEGNLHSEHEKVIKLMTKIIMLHDDPLGCINHIVEIAEESYEDPWSGDTYSTQTVSPETINQVEDFDPWATSNEF